VFDRRVGVMGCAATGGSARAAPPAGPDPGVGERAGYRNRISGGAAGRRRYGERGRVRFEDGKKVMHGGAHAAALRWRRWRGGAIGCVNVASDHSAGWRVSGGPAIWSRRARSSATAP
jgi:hypothetical protein